MNLMVYPEIRVNKPQSAQRTAESTETLEKPLWFKNNANIVVIVIYKGVAHVPNGAARDK